ncbi:MAG TPA: 5-oxoprolinase subunit PxpB [Gemmataceae bacterium]|jgi:inhibitor of KinA|nr:5-oxoprolinase subunit PxpB [Gemmataceae bacterium]
MNFDPLGDQAVLATFKTEAAALHFAAAVEAAGLPGVIDIVPAYFSVAVFFDLGQTQYAKLVPSLKQVAKSKPARKSKSSARQHIIPCCYELGHDRGRIAEHTGLTIEEVIRLHSDAEYTVYAIGFCPGFPYLGYLPKPLCGLPRLPSPRLRVEPGSVGLTGQQTGIYPLERPGGWNLLGRTPLLLVDVEDGYFPIRAGDRVKFQRIDEAEFKKLEGERL